jgi:uncharacterized protein YjdB
MAAGGQQQFTATGSYDDGSSQDITSSVSWSSSASDVVNVDSSGMATAQQAAGTATITATDSSSGVSGSTNATVTAATPTLQSIAVTPDSPSLAGGAQQQLTATGSYDDGSSQDITSSVSWSSSASDVVDVDSSGMATAQQAAGTATITASDSASGVTGSTNATVTAGAPQGAVLQSIAVSPDSPSLAAGAQQQFTATGSYDDGSTQDITSSVSWSSSASDVVNVDSSGMATAQQAAGTATITATDSSSGVSGSTNATVTAGAPQGAVLQSIAVTPDSPSMAAGAQQQFTATGSYDDGSSQDITSSVSWSSSASDVVVVDGSGMATAQQAAGTATITATDSSSGVSGSTNATVTAGAPPQPQTKVLQSIAISPDSPSLTGGAQQQLTATGTFSDNSTQDITSSVTWSSSATDVINVDATGLAKAGTGAGTATITATDSTTGVNGSTTATVTAAKPVLQSINIWTTSTTMACGVHQMFQAQGTFSDGSKYDISNNCNWVSSAPEIVAVDPNGIKGWFFAIPETGTATITATEPSTGLSGSVTITVRATGLTDDKTKADMQAALNKADKDALEKLVDNDGGGALDDLVEKMPDPPDRKQIVAALAARFHIDMTATDLSSNPDDVTQMNKSLKKLYETMLKVPEADVRNNPNLKAIDRSGPEDKTHSDYYQNKKIHLCAYRIDAGHPQIGNPSQLPDVDDDCKPKDDQTPPHLDWNSLHEVGHAVDDKMQFMNGRMGNATFGNWKIETVASVAGVAAAFFGCNVKDIQPLLTGTPPKTPPPVPSGTDPTTWQNAVAWCTGVRASKKPWDDGSGSKSRAISGRVYHEAYDQPVQWVSYDLAARKKGISGYQFRAPGEWFAELYAAYHLGKLKDSNPNVPWLETV